MAQGSVDPALRNWLHATQVKSNKLEYQVFLRFAFIACFLFISSSSIRMSSSSSLIPKRKLKQRQDKRCIKVHTSFIHMRKGFIQFIGPSTIHDIFLLFPALRFISSNSRRSSSWSSSTASRRLPAKGARQNTREAHTWSRIVEINRPWLHTNFMKMEMNVALFIYLLASSFCCSFQLLSINFNAYSLSSLYLTGILVHCSYKMVCVHVAISEMPTFQ